MNSDGDSDILVPLRQWMEDESKHQLAARQRGTVEEKRCHQEGILRKTTVAYGMAELLRHTRAHPSAVSTGEQCSIEEQCGIDNFVVRMSEDAESTRPRWSDVKGVDMRAPKLSVSILEPSFLSGSFSDLGDDEPEEELTGRYLEADFPTVAEEEGVESAAISQSEEDERCHAMGVTLYEMFSQLSPLPDDGGAPKEPEPKKMKTSDPTDDDVTAGEEGRKGPVAAPYIPLTELGFPSSICLLVQNLLDCRESPRPHNAYDSLDAVIKDLHLLLLDPGRFLFDLELVSINGSVKLSFRKHKLYGRESEVTSITDAFCRVSDGTSEACFIGGFSGSGKSRLVNSLTARVDVSEGYVITHKFDQMSKERPLLEVIAVFNDLCNVIRRKSSQKDLLATTTRLMDVFGSDFSTLARLLPSVAALSPQLKDDAAEVGSDDHMNLRSVCFLLQRFMRVVSSKSHPVMLFLDDLQWCDASALALIEGILCDAIGSSCLFFVGSYRSNEISDDHDMFRFMKSLESSGVPTTKLSLEGLNPEDLNTMLSDALCTFPRICEPLSDMVFQKTKGNPYFVLEFLRSLVEGGQLEYSAQKRRWEWDEDRISSMDITGNVLYLLSTKMSGLSESIQTALKVAACFGIKIKESVVEYLSAKAEYSHLRDGLEQVIREGFMMKDGTSEFMFVHDKVREAAYSLIPDLEKNQYHYNLGMALYSMTKGSDLNDVVFSIVDQINHGMKDSKNRSPDLQIMELADLNEMAAVKATDRSDFVTAHSYLNTALSLLPTDLWKSHYDQSLRLSFLSAKTAHSCGYLEKAYGVLQQIITNARCLSDKLDAYHLVVVILNDREAIEEAYTTAYEVLLQLGEDIPDRFDEVATKKMVKETSVMLGGLSEDSLLGMDVMNEAKQHILKFYSSITVVAFNAKPAMLPFFTCRMVQLTKEHGICKYSLIGFVQFAAMSCSNVMVSNIKGGIRIGKIAMSSLKRFDSASVFPRLMVIYHGFVSIYSEPVHKCAESQHRAFESGVATGDASSGFLGAVHNIRLAMVSGEALPTVLKRLEYYLGVTSKYGNTFSKTHLFLYRDTLLLLMGKTDTDNYSQVQENALKNFSLETTYYHKATRAFWIGHSERCHHFIEKLFQGVSGSGGRHLRGFLYLLYGLNSFRITRRTTPQKTKAIPHNALKALKTAAEYSRWNFINKVHLLEAEIASHEGRDEDAKASYAAAISSSRASRFTHEAGLACELAGFHHKKMGDHRSAWGFFNQAKQCYTDWGCQTKVDYINRQLETFQISLA